MQYLLLFLLFLLLYKLHTTRRGHPDFFFRKQYKYQISDIKYQKTLTQRSRILEWLSRPGRMCEALTSEKTLKKLELLQYPPNSFMRAKQTILTFMILYFWLFIWFGELNTKNLFWLLILYIILFSIPDLWLQARYERRLKVLGEEVPSFMDLLSLVLQSGLNLEQALAYLSEDQNSFIATKVKAQLALMNLGKTLEEVLKNLQAQVPIEDWHHFLSSILHAKQLGVSLASTLETQSEILRTKRRQRAEELSRTASVKITLPLVLFIFPALLIIYLGPGLIHLMNN
ncbi:MAG TPA: type II secretion system F family protein [Candidatus Gracilibacteria bacterium]